MTALVKLKYGVEYYLQIFSLFFNFKLKKLSLEFIITDRFDCFPEIIERISINFQLRRGFFITTMHHHHQPYSWPAFWSFRAQNTMFTVFFFFCIIRITLDFFSSEQFSYRNNFPNKTFKFMIYFTFDIESVIINSNIFRFNIVEEVEVHWYTSWVGGLTSIPVSSPDLKLSVFISNFLIFLVLCCPFMNFSRYTITQTHIRPSRIIQIDRLIKSNFCLFFSFECTIKFIFLFKYSINSFCHRILITMIYFSHTYGQVSFLKLIEICVY